jgi:hypothetical protein
MVHSLLRLLHSILANYACRAVSATLVPKKVAAPSKTSERYAFLVTVCRFKVSGLAFNMATSCAVGKYRWDMTPTASVKLTATNPAENSFELS